MDKNWRNKTPEEKKAIDNFIQKEIAKYKSKSAKKERAKKLQAQNIAKNDNSNDEKKGFV